uniref:Histone-lysine N-methyltransferase n=1 Tax=Plectus sambesii TaxID=2011161 RepID=A0A914WYS3_9BILA
MVGRRSQPVRSAAKSDGVKKTIIAVVAPKAPKEVKKAKKKRKSTVADDSTSDGEYEVEEVLDHHYEVDGSVEFYIKWKGYSIKESTWEPEENTSGCPEKVVAYWKAHLREYWQQHFVKEQCDPNVRWHLENYHEQLDSANSFIDALDENDILCLPAENSPDLNKLSSAALVRWEAEINDLSKGRGEAKISVSNSIDSEGPPWGRRFVVQRELSLPSDARVDQTPLNCQCTGHSCPLETNSKCCARHNGSQLAYDENGHLVEDYVGPIYECSKGCECSSKCINRQVQRGRQVAVEIYRTKSHRWALRSRDPISSGGFVSEIVGEVVNMEEALRRNKAYGLILSGAYLFELHQDHGKARFVLDRSSGNITNFVRHSCEPNLVIRTVYSDIEELSLPRLALFALKDIKPGDQLTVDFYPESTHCSFFYCS